MRIKQVPVCKGLGLLGIVHDLQQKLRSHDGSGCPEVNGLSLFGLNGVKTGQAGSNTCSTDLVQSAPQAKVLKGPRLVFSSGS